ncbi:MAG: hypothetical protein EAZ98_09130, partial [Oscillatoriales cyanobacterium]
GKEIQMGSKKGLTYIIELRYYSTISSIVPQLRYNYKFDRFNYRWGSSCEAIGEKLTPSRAKSP